jgi:3-deoxy-7-phosphoheptulonate synthase
MIIVLKPGADQDDIRAISQLLEERGLRPHVSTGEQRTIIGAIGDERLLQEVPLTSLPGVEKVIPILKPYKLVSREYRPENSIVSVRGIPVGGKEIIVMAGPCSVEDRGLLLEIAFAVKEAGAKMLRGGAFKPRTSPYAFQGLGEQGLKYLAEAREKTGLAIVTELMDPRDLPLFEEHVDLIQIGARNMQNFKLLQDVGRSRIPVLLKRGISASINEWLMSAEYIMSEGNGNVILCERGIRTFETATRNTLDLSAVPLVKGLSHLPVAVDPSHGVGAWELVSPMARGAVAVGADALMVEVHSHPERALSDGEQSLLPEKFARMMRELREIAPVLGRTLAP